LSIHKYPKLFEGVEPAFVKWVASKNAPDCFQTTFEDAVFGQRLYCVLATGRVEPAGWGKQRGNKFLINPDKPNKKISH